MPARAEPEPASRLRAPATAHVLRVALRLGYAAVNTLLPAAGRRPRAGEPVAAQVPRNLDALEAILRWNAEHDVAVYRLSPNLVPYATHPDNRLRWWDRFGARFAELAALLRETGARLSIHPGQYVQLGAESDATARRGIAELEHQARVLRALELDAAHPIVLHAGSRRDGARERFVQRVELLSDDLRARLALENDEAWPLSETIALAAAAGLAVAYDAFHHRLRPSEPADDREAALAAAATWAPARGRPEVHFSTQAEGRRRGTHAPTLDGDAWLRFAERVHDLPLDVILEVKDREQSVLRARELLARVRTRSGSRSSAAAPPRAPGTAPPTRA